MSGGHVLAGVARKFGGGDERGDAGRERRRREATQVLPAVELRERPFADEELRGGTDHDRIRVVVEAARNAEAPGEEDCERDLVELNGGPVGSTVDRPVL